MSTARAATLPRQAGGSCLCDGCRRFGFLGINASALIDRRPNQCRDATTLRGRIAKRRHDATGNKAVPAAWAALLDDLATAGAPSERLDELAASDGAARRHDVHALRLALSLAPSPTTNATEPPPRSHARITGAGPPDHQPDTAPNHPRAVAHTLTAAPAAPPPHRPERHGVSLTPAT